jgi:hypothetical protein
MTGRREAPWQAVGLIMFGLLVAEGFIKVWVEQRKN